MNGCVEDVSESDVKDENILGHFRETLQRVSSAVSNERLASEIMELETFDAEYACLRTFMLEPENPTLWNAMALVYMMASLLEEAEEAIERSLDIDTSNSWTWSIWGDLLKQEKRTAEAERTYRMAVELDSRNEHALRQLVHLFISRGAHPETLLILEQLLPIAPDDQELWDIYSDCHRHLLK